MKKSKNKTLVNLMQNEYETICNQYIEKFCEKQELEFEYWVDDNIGGVACFPDYWFNFNDIKLDIDGNIPAGTITEWQNESLLYHYHYKGLYLNYQSYANGLRYSYLVERQEEDKKRHNEKVRVYKEKLTEIVKQSSSIERNKNKKEKKKYVDLTMKFVKLIPSHILKHAKLLFDERGIWKYYIWESLYKEQTGNISQGIKFGFYLDKLEQAVTILNNQILVGGLNNLREDEIQVFVNAYDFLLENWYLFFSHNEIAEEQFKTNYIDKVMTQTTEIDGEKTESFILVDNNGTRKIEYRDEDFTDYLNFELKEVS